MVKTIGDSALPADDAVHDIKPGDGDCWRHIGVSGDRTCSELSAFIHCRNCPVFAAAARTFFDRRAPEGYLAEWSRWLARSIGQGASEGQEDKAENERQREEKRVSMLIFRLETEWLAFRTQTVAEVTTPRPIHRVPRRTNEVFLGLVNLQGQVQLCVSLHGLLGITASSAPARLVVLRDRNRGENWAFVADEVLGVQHISRSRWRGVPATLTNPAVGFSQAVLSWNDRSIGLLDEERVFNALRSLQP
jgi:chemotaxis-related protein WspD